MADCRSLCLGNLTSCTCQPFLSQMISALPLHLIQLSRHAGITSKQPASWPWSFFRARAIKQLPLLSLSPRRRPSPRQPSESSSLLVGKGNTTSSRFLAYLLDMRPPGVNGVEYGIMPEFLSMSPWAAARQSSGLRMSSVRIDNAGGKGMIQEAQNH
jgi:hypothetical protein